MSRCHFAPGLIIFVSVGTMPVVGGGWGGGGGCQYGTEDVVDWWTDM